MKLHPEGDAGRLSIVDVRCRDRGGRNFIVGMQIWRTPSLFLRTMLNACRIFSRQPVMGRNLEHVQPVYTLCLLDHVLFPQAVDWIHHFDTLSVRPGTPGMTGMGLLRLTFVALRKWSKSGNLDKQDMRHAWMRFFTKPDAMLEVYTPEERQQFREMYAAVVAWDPTRYTEDALWRMDKQIDNYLTHQDYLQGAYGEGLDEGMEKGMEIGTDKRIRLGRSMAIRSVIALMRDMAAIDAAGDDMPARRHGVTAEEVRHLRELTRSA